MGTDGKSGRRIETRSKSGEGWQVGTKGRDVEEVMASWGMHFAIRELISSLLAISMHCHIDALCDAILHVSLRVG